MGAREDTKGELGWEGEKVVKAMGVFVVETVMWPSSPGRLNEIWSVSRLSTLRKIQVLKVNSTSSQIADIRTGFTCALMDQRMQRLNFFCNHNSFQKL